MRKSEYKLRLGFYLFRIPGIASQFYGNKSQLP